MSRKQSSDAPHDVAPEKKPEPIDETWSRIKRPELIYPRLRDLLVEAQLAAEARGTRYWILSGHRDENEQAALYAKGRSEPGPVVTNAKPFYSTHNYGLAGDACVDKDVDRKGLQPDWNLAAYRVWAEECVKVGLEAAYYWKSFKEGPHAQVPLQKLGFTLRDGRMDWERLKKLYAEGGLEAVWAEVDKRWR